MLKKCFNTDTWRTTFDTLEIENLSIKFYWGCCPSIDTGNKNAIFRIFPMIKCLRFYCQIIVFLLDKPMMAQQLLLLLATWKMSNKIQSYEMTAGAVFRDIDFEIMLMLFQENIFSKWKGFYSKTQGLTQATQCLIFPSYTKKKLSQILGRFVLCSVSQFMLVLITVSLC